MIRIFSVLLLTVSIGFAQKNYIHDVVTYIPNQPPQADSAYKLSQFIDTNRLKEVLNYLASDSCQGRELGTPGNDRASTFISSKFSSFGIPFIPGKDSYFQQVDFRWISWEYNEINIDDYDYRQIWDYVSIPTENESLSIQTDSIVFLGYGIESPTYSDYASLSLRGKTIVIYNGEPHDKNGINYLTGSTHGSIFASRESKLRAASRHGVACVMIVEEKFRELADQNRSSLYSPVVQIANKVAVNLNPVNTVFISSTMFSKIIGPLQKKIIAARDKINKSHKPKYVVIKTPVRIKMMKQVKEVKGNNILAYFEGTDKKDEVLIISAHYDHIGMRGQDVFNGADDNASGSSAVTEIARILSLAASKGMKTRRSVLCMLMTGEEKGLLGSMYYVNDPVFPLDKTIADINIDMIGRTDQKYEGNKSYIYVIGSDRLSKDLHKANEDITRLYSHLTMDYTYNAEDDPNRYYYRSDHYNFAEKGIPAIFFFSGVHEDYHRITDDPEKIIYDKYLKVVQHAFLLAWRLANQEQRPELDK